MRRSDRAHALLPVRQPGGRHRDPRGSGIVAFCFADADADVRVTTMSDSLTIRSAGTPFGLQDLQPLEAGGTIPLPLTISSRRTNLIGCFIADFGVPSIGIFDATLRRVSQGRGCARTGALRGGDDSG